MKRFTTTIYEEVCTLRYAILYSFNYNIFTKYIMSFFYYFEKPLKNIIPKFRNVEKSHVMEEKM